MQVDDIARVICKGVLGTQPVLNRYYYQLKNNAGTLETLASLFNSTVLSPLMNMFHSALHFSELDIRNLNLPMEQIEHPINQTGTLTGERLPPHDAVRIQLATNSPYIRNGAKVFSGIPESRSEGYKFADGYIATWATILHIFADNLPDGGTGANWVPVIYTPGNEQIPTAFAWGVDDVILNEVPATQRTRRIR
jgi:hypothetical protein